MKARVLTGLTALILGGLLPGLGAEELEPPFSPPAAPSSVCIYRNPCGGTRDLTLDENDQRFWSLAMKGDTDAAVALAKSTRKNLESCCGYRALVYFSQETRSQNGFSFLYRGAERKKLTQRFASVSAALLPALIDAGVVDFRNTWDWQEVATRDPLRYFTRLKPGLTPEKLSQIDGAHLLGVLRHPDFPREFHASPKVDYGYGLVWLLSDQTVGLPAVTDELLAFGLNPKLLRDAAQSPEVLRHLLEKGALDTSPPQDHELLHALLRFPDDAALWQLAVAQGLRWRTAKGLQLRFAEWHVLQARLKVDLYRPETLTEVLKGPWAYLSAEEISRFLDGAGPTLAQVPLGSWDAGWNAEILKRLPASCRDAQGRNLLFYARGPDTVVALHRRGLDPKELDADGRNPLFSRDGFSPDTALLRSLLAAGAEPKIFDKKGDQILFDETNVEILKVLLAGGADPKLRSPDKKKTVWNTFNTTRMVSCSAVAYRSKEEFVPWMDCLLEHGTDPALSDDRGTTPLMVFARAGRPLLVRRLLKEGPKARPDARDADGHNALDAVFLQKDSVESHFASPKNQLLAAKLLQAAGLKLSIDAQSPGLNTKLWQDWKQLQTLPANDQMLPLIPALIWNHDPAFLAECFPATPPALLICAELPDWDFANALLSRHPELVQPGSESTRQLLALLDKQEALIEGEKTGKINSIYVDRFRSFQRLVRQLAVQTQVKASLTPPPR